jgi:hypothetical protein
MLLIRSVLAAAGLSLGVALAAPTLASAQGHIALSDAERALLDAILKDVLGDTETLARTAPPGLAKQTTLPPGLAKRAALPPGLAKRLDERLEEALPDRDAEVTDDAVILTDTATGAVVAVIRDLMSPTRGY